MKIHKILSFSLAIFIMASCSLEKSGEKNGEVTVEINYGRIKSTKESKVAWRDGLTALEALQYTALVETHNVSNFVFVNSIDSIRGERGITAWYYKINGEAPKTLAITNILKPGDTISWIYKEDVCSKTVDKCKESI